MKKLNDKLKKKKKLNGKLKTYMMHGTYAIPTTH